MEEDLAKLKIRFPTLPQDALRKIYRCRFERIKVLMRLSYPEDVRWIIEAKVCLAGEISNSFSKHLPGIGRSSYSKKRRAKRMGVCYKCARWTCDTRYRNVGFPSTNQEDKIQFITNGLSKEPLDNIVQALEMHPNGDVHRIFLNLLDLLKKEKECYSLRDPTSKDHVCQFVRKLDGKLISSSYQAVGHTECRT